MEGGICIKILCPDCRRELNDRFEAKEANLLPNERYYFEFECVHCDQIFRTSIVANVEMQHDKF